jgi:hypothetical protein
MSGNAGRCVRANGAKSLEVNNVLFLDYYTLNGFYHSKTGAGVSWVYAHNPPAGVWGAETPVIKVVNSQFDEASFFGMEIDGYPVFEAERNRINNSSSGSAAGFRLNDIKHAILKQNHVGYNNVDIPLFKATDVGDQDAWGNFSGWSAAETETTPVIPEVPGDFAQLVHWNRVKSIAGASESDPTGTLEDLEGSADLTSAGANRPLYRANSGQPYLELASSSDYLEGPQTSLNDFTIILIVEVVANP